MSHIEGAMVVRRLLMEKGRAAAVLEGLMGSAQTGD